MRTTLAGFLDERLLDGPINKKQLALEGEQVRLTLGHSMKCTPGTVRAHARYRADTGPYKFWEDGDLLWLTRCDDPISSLEGGRNGQT